MTAFKRIASLKPKEFDDSNCIIVELADNKTYSLNKSSLDAYSTTADLKTAMEASVGNKIADIFFHKNRDGSYAIATGREPKVWPEDEEKR